MHEARVTFDLLFVKNDSYNLKNAGKSVHNAIREIVKLKIDLHVL